MPIVTRESKEQSPRREVIYEHGERRTGAERRQASDHEQAVTTATLTGGSMLELLGGGAAVVLAILGLAGFLPMYMAAIATIAIGGALVTHGAAAAARWQDTVQRASGKRKRTEVGGGLGSEMFGGVCGIVLAILALANVVPAALLSVAAIVLGGSILLGAPAQPELAKSASDVGGRFGRVTYEAIEATSGAMALVGIGAVVLGILALIGVGPVLTLVMVSMLGIGGALFLAGSALTARFVRQLQQAT
jgi:hypothetical protein